MNKRRRCHAARRRLERKSHVRRLLADMRWLRETLTHAGPKYPDIHFSYPRWLCSRANRMVLREYKRRPAPDIKFHKDAFAMAMKPLTKEQVERIGNGGRRKSP